MKIFISDPVDEQCVDLLKQEGFAVVYQPGLDAGNLKSALADADALIVRSQTKVTAGILESAKKLKVVGRAGAGVDNIDVDAATRKGVVVMNTPGGNTISTAEHTLSMMFALARNIPQANQSLREGKWDRKKFTGTELNGKLVGLIGLGRVGSEVAKRCLAFGMDVIAYDPLVSSESAAKLGVRLAELPEIFQTADIISVHSPLTAETRNLINAKTLAQCKKGVRIINCARGGIVHEKDLLQALESEQVAAAALDVFEQEPPADHSLIRHPHVVSTPHLGASTEEAQEKVAIQIAHQIADFLLGRGVSGSVNGDIVRYTFRKEFHPYFTLVERMGKLLSQLKNGVLRSVVLTVNGAYLHELTSLLGAAFFKGVFSDVLTEPINYINALAIAKDRGISVSLQQADDHVLYANVISVSYETTKEQRSFAGTVFGTSDERLIAMDGFHLDIRPQGILLLYSNVDRPGMLARVSGLLAQAQINIGGLSLGRYPGHARALTIIALDDLPPAHVLENIAKEEGISDLHLITL